MARDSPAFRSVAPKLGFVAPLDGLRGFGIAVVVLGHASGDRIQGFLSIIDCFFILSGFLIVTLLLQEQRSTGGVDFRKFYSRRAVRLLPALWVNLVFWLLVGVVAELAGKLGHTGSLGSRYFGIWDRFRRVAKAIYARTSGASMIAGYLGGGEKAAKAFSRFARLYADQTEADHAALVKAAREGRIPVADGALAAMGSAFRPGG